MARVPNLFAKVVQNQGQEVHHTQGELFSSISSVHVGKHFDREKLRYHQTVGDHLLGIMLLQFQQIYEAWEYPKSLLYIEEVSSTSSQQKQLQKISLANKTKENQYLNEFIQLLACPEFSTYIRQ